MAKGIYDRIVEAITDEGTLSSEFILPDEERSELKFAPGAMDGILFYHGGFYSEKTEDCKSLIVNAIRKASKGKEEKAMKIAEQYAITGRTLEFIDEIQQYIIENRMNLNADKIMHFAVDLMLNGGKIEAVKFGMSILELFNINQNEKLKEVVRNIGLCDEFTLFAAFIMDNWENAAMELWNAAKHVRGWGRVHLMRIIDPQGREDIEQWMIAEGIHNEVLSAYSGLDIFEKTHYMRRLEETLSLEMYQSMADVMIALLDEGPVQGISTIDDIGKLFYLFIQATKKREDLEAEDYWACAQILDYMEEHNDPQDNFSEMKDDLKEFLSAGKVREIIYSALENGEGLRIAQELGYDYQEYAYRAALKEPRKHAYVASNLIGKGYKSQELVDFYYNELEIGKIGTGPEDNMGLGKGYEIHNTVDYILQNLNEHIGLGENIVRTAMVSPVTRNRNGALRVMESWMQITKRPLNEISPVLFDALKAAEPNEVVVSVKERMKKILRNEIEIEKGITIEKKR